MNNEPTQFTVDGLAASEIVVTLDNAVVRDIRTRELTPSDIIFDSVVSATFEVDRDTYAQLARDQTYTVEITTDHNPWHRKTENWRQRNWKVLHGLIWTFRKRILRRELAERSVVIVPDCQLRSPLGPA